MAKVWLCMALVACSGGQHGAPGGGNGVPAVKTYAPLGIKADAKSPSQAVILGTDDKNGSTVLPLPAAPSKASVDAMWIRLAPIPSGGSTPVKLSTAPNGDGSVQVGIYEEIAGGVGPQWRAGVWVSAFVAATTLGKDLTDFTFAASTTGYIDGASASGLMAGGFLAAMTGTPIDPTVTMTGTINPDGTIGPVGGIPEKFAASLDKGKKKLGYPIGMQFAKSEASGQMVDLVKLAKDRGAEAIEIANVHEAYKLLTGKQLPEPVPVAEADMAVDDETGKALEARYKDWQKQLAGEWAALLQLGQSGRLPTTLLKLASRAQELAAQAEKLHHQGLHAAAYRKAVEAWIDATSANATFAVLSRVQANDTPGAIGKLGGVDELAKQTGTAFGKIGTIRPGTLGGHLQMMSAFQAALRSLGFELHASKSLETAVELVKSLANNPDLGSTKVGETVANQVIPTMLLVGRSRAETALALEALEVETEKSVNYLCSIPNVQRLSTSFQSASVAGINYFDVLLVEPLAQQAGLSQDAARERIALAEPDYLVAMVASKLPKTEGLAQDLKAAWGETSIAWGLMSLAGNEMAYFDAAQLVTKYYSLGVQTDETGRADKLQQDRAFTNMLASAERSARASARAARIATGSIPVQAKLAYQLAVVDREGDVADKLDALAAFWLSSAFSQTAVALARN
jgi:hypothetical protein